MILIQITQDGRAAVLNPQRIAQGTDSESIVLLSPFPARCPVLMGWIMPDQVPLTADDAPEGANGNYYPMVNVIPTPDFGVSADSVLSVWVYKPTKAYTAQAGTANACFLVQQQKDDGNGGYQYENLTTNPVEIEITETILPSIPQNPTTSMWKDVIAAITYYNEHVANLDDAVEDIQEELANGITAVHDTEGEVQRDVYTDAAPTEDSDNLVTSGGVFNAIGSALDTAEGYADGVASTAEHNANDYTDRKIAEIPVGGGQTTVYGTNNVAQSEVHTDSTPTLNSKNVVTSDGIKRAIDDAQFAGEGTHVYEDGVGASRLDIPKIYNSVDEVISGADGSTTMAQLIAAMSENAVLSSDVRNGAPAQSAQPVYKGLLPSGAYGTSGILNVYKRVDNGIKSGVAQYAEKPDYDYVWDNTSNDEQYHSFAVCEGKAYICPTADTADIITVKDLATGTSTTLALSEDDSVYWFAAYSFKTNDNNPNRYYNGNNGVIVFGRSAGSAQTLYFACVKDGEVTVSCTQVSTDYTISASNTLFAVGPTFALVYQKAQGVVVMINKAGDTIDVALGLSNMAQMVVEQRTYASPMYLCFFGAGKIFRAMVHYNQSHSYSEVGTPSSSAQFHRLLGATSTTIYYSTNGGYAVYSMASSSGSSSLIGMLPQSIDHIVSYDIDTDLWTSGVGIYKGLSGFQTKKPSVYIGTNGSTSPSFYNLIRGTGSDANKVFWNDGSYILLDDATVHTWSGAIDQSGAFTWQSLDSAEVDTSEIEAQIDEVAEAVAGKLNSWGDIPAENILPEGIDLRTVTVANGYKKGWYKASYDFAASDHSLIRYEDLGYPMTGWIRPDATQAGTFEFLYFVSDNICIAINSNASQTGVTWNYLREATSVGGGTETWSTLYFTKPLVFISVGGFGEDWMRVPFDRDIFGEGFDNQGYQSRLLKTSRMADDEVLKQAFAPSMELFQKCTPTRVYKEYTEIVSSGTIGLKSIIDRMESNSIAMMSITTGQRGTLGLHDATGNFPTWGAYPTLYIFKIGQYKAIAYFVDTKNVLMTHFYIDISGNTPTTTLTPWISIEQPEYKYNHHIALWAEIGTGLTAFLDFTFIEDASTAISTFDDLLSSVENTAVGADVMFGISGYVEQMNVAQTAIEYVFPIVNAIKSSTGITIDYINTSFSRVSHTITSSDYPSVSDTFVRI